MKKFFSLLEDNICAIILLVMMLLTCVNVVARYVLKASMPFVEELTCLGPVSYTHLDVYKRQDDDFVIRSFPISKSQSGGDGEKRGGSVTRTSPSAI